MNMMYLQILSVEKMITIEFKLTDEEGYNTYLTKIIETEADFEQFKNELSRGITTLEQIVKKAIKKDQSYGTS